MRFWLTTLFLVLFVPVIISITGILYIKKPVKHINCMHGYCTERAMKHQDAWDFAQKYFGNVCFRLGIGFTLLTLISMFSVFGQNKKNIEMLGNVIGIAEVFLLICVLIPTERALQKKYE